MGHWADGSSKRVSGTPENENTKAAAQRAEAQQLAYMASRPNPESGATEEPPNTRNAPASDAPSEAPRPAATKIIPTLTAFAETFLAVTKPDNKPCTVENKEAMLRLYILPHLGDLRVCDVDDAVIQDFRATLQATLNVVCKREARTVHPNTANKVLGCLKHVLRLAHTRGLREKVPTIKKLPAPPSKFDFLTFEEADRLIAAAEGEWHTFVTVGLNTGLRRGELLALEKTSVDLKHPRLHVCRNLYRGRFGTPKSGRNRYVDLNERATAALAAHTHDRSALVFCDAKGKPLTASRVRCELRRICKRAGLRRIGPHVLRHTFASHLVMRGVPLSVVQKLMGHSSIVVTQRYAHLMPEMTRSAVLLLDRADPPQAAQRAVLAAA